MPQTTIDQIDAGELEREINQAIQACVEDIQRSEDLEEPRQVSATLKFTPTEGGQVKITYDVTPKLAKRKGEEQGYVDKQGYLRLGEPQQKMELPLREPEKEPQAAEG